LTHFDPRDARQMAALLVFMEYSADEIVETLVARYDVRRQDAIDLVADLLTARIEHEDKTEEVRKQHLAAVAAEWDLERSMHER
jgi:polyhydroxyalkanoate synthesis regulator phasin